jgi:hypothetical protein
VSLFSGRKNSSYNSVSVSSPTSSNRMELLSMFDVEFDFPAGRVRLYKPGSAKLLETTSMVPIPAVVINDTGLIGIRLTAPGKSQPVLAFLDCGSTFSAVNWKAAKLLGLPDKGDPIYEKAKIMAFGIDGRPMELPIVMEKFSFLGESMTNNGQLIGFAEPPATWEPWDATPIGVGDLPAFSSVLGDGVRPFTGPAALVGIDVIGQRRVIFEAGSGTRERRILVSSR